MGNIINFDDVPDAYAPPPPGRYACRVMSVEKKTSRNGNPTWALALEVINGPCAGAQILDNLTWTLDGLKRVKLVLARLGVFDVLGYQIDPEKLDLRGFKAMVTIEEEEWADEATGETKKRVRVPFAGYDRWADEPAAMPAVPAGPATGSAKGKGAASAAAASTPASSPAASAAGYGAPKKTAVPAGRGGQADFGIDDIPF